MQPIVYSQAGQTWRKFVLPDEVSEGNLRLQEVMLRRLKKDVMAQLPPKRRQVVRLPHVESLWTKLKKAHPGLDLHCKLAHVSQA